MDTSVLLANYWATRKTSLVDMISVREFKESDMQQVKLLHDKYYPNLDFPRFMKYLCSFVIEDEFGEIVLAAGFEQIAELSLVTNQDKSPVVRGRALRECKKVAFYLCDKFNINEVYAFTDDNVLAKHIVQHDFCPAPRAFSIRMKNGQE